MGAEEEEGQEEEEEEEEEKEEKAEGEGCRALRRQDAVRRPRRDLRQEQYGPLGGREAEEGRACQLGEHVQDDGDVFQAHQVSARLNRTAAAWRNLMRYRRCRVSPIFDPWT